MFYATFCDNQSEFKKAFLYLDINQTLESFARMKQK